MTKEEYKLAEGLINDIEVLTSIKETQEKNHWVEFRTADDPKEMLSMYTDVLIDDFQKFVADELEKLTNMFSEM